MTFSLQEAADILALPLPVLKKLHLVLALSNQYSQTGRLGEQTLRLLYTRLHST
jgi:hypothetical protein